jgi:hypothetical protein
MIEIGSLSGETVASYFGYDVTALDLNGDGLDDLVVGAPFYYKSAKGGAVYVFLNQNDPEKLFNQEQGSYTELYGQKASRFGTCVTSLGDINNDGITDLAVGAPGTDRGEIHVFFGKKGITDAGQLFTKADQVCDPRFIIGGVF